jgi:hypothetical protein
MSGVSVSEAFAIDSLRRHNPLLTDIGIADILNGRRALRGVPFRLQEIDVARSRFQSIPRSSSGDGFHRSVHVSGGVS